MDSNVQSVSDLYDRIARGDFALRAPSALGFINVGYWKGVEGGLEAAQIKLLETLLEFFVDTSGTVLDVACGEGMSSKFLAKLFDPKKVTGINISEGQLQKCRDRAPECTFHFMDATELTFTDASFDNVLCIQAAQHFMTRTKFLREAHRVLRPGGRLAIHDAVFHRHAVLFDLPENTWPKENCLPDLNSYRERVLEAGFKYVRVEDVTEYSVVRLAEKQRARAEREFSRSGQYAILEEAMRLDDSSPWGRRNCSWCMAFAIK